MGTFVEITLSHIPVPACGKDKKVSICDVVVMLKLSQYVASQRIQNFLEVFFMFFQVVLFVCFVALRPRSTAMVTTGWSVHLTTIFPGQA